VDDHLAAKARVGASGVVVVVHLDREFHVELVGLGGTALEVGVVAFAGGFLIDRTYAVGRR
jgi:hypothetical protein